MDTENKIVYEENLGLNDSIPNLSSYNGFANRKVNDDKEESDKTIYDKDSTSITIEPSTLNLTIGEQVKLSIEPGKFTDNPPIVVWESSNPFVVSIDSNGIATGKKEGNVTITATNSEDTTITSTLNVKVSETSLIPIEGPSIGDILCSDGTYITPTIDWETGECTAIELDDKTPIGIVVVPGSHTPDNTERIMSLLECDLDNPSTPTTSHNSIYWGENNSDIPGIDNYDTVPLEFTLDAPGAMAYHIKSGLVFGTIWSTLRFGEAEQILTLYENTGLYYLVSSDDAHQNGMSFVKPLYLSDGRTINPDSLVGAMSDWDGKEHTATLISLATSDINWRTGSITNSSEDGYYPAACACYRYNTPGTQEGDWYLPTVRELAYISYYYTLFNSILTKLNELNDDSAVALPPTDYWSSTEYPHLTIGNENYFPAWYFCVFGLSSISEKGVKKYVRPFYKPTHS